MIAALLSILLLPTAASAVSIADYNAIQHHLTLAGNLTGHAQQLEMNRAIRLTIQAYGLLPTQDGRIQMPQGTSAVEGFSQQGRRDWVFTYDSTLRDTFSVNDAYGPIRGRSTPTTDALTAPNGMTVFWVDPARINPNGLAFLVDHEIEHFKSFMTPGRGNQLVAQQEIDIYTLQRNNLEKYGYLPDLHGRYGPYANAYAHCSRQIADHTAQRDAQSTLLATTIASIQAWRHRRGAPVYAEGRTVFIDHDELERIRQNAEALNASIQSADEQRRHVIEQEALTPRPVPPPPAFPADASRPFIPPPGFYPDEPAAMRTGAMLDVAAAACRGAWEDARQRFAPYRRLTPQDLVALGNWAAAQPLGCQRSIIERLIAMNRNGDVLSVERLQAEIAALTTAPRYTPPTAPAPRDTPRNCTERGIWFKHCY